MAVTSTLFYVQGLVDNTVANTLSNSSVDDVLVTGASAGAPSDLTPNDPLGNQAFDDLVVDAADGVYFVDKLTNSGGKELSSVYEETLGGTAAFTTPAFTFSDPNDDSIGSMALNTADDIVYFTANTGLYEEKFGAGFSGTPSQIPLATFGLGVSSMVFDKADHTIYALDTSDSASGTNQLHVTNNVLYKVTGVTKNATRSNTQVTDVFGTTALGKPAQFPWQTDGVANTIALDTADDTLYIGTLATSIGGKFGVYADPLSGPGAGTLTAVFQGTLTATNNVTEPAFLTIDPVTGEYYFSDGGGQIYAGSVTSHNAPTVLLSVDTANTTTNIYNIAVDDPPTVSSVAVTAIDGNTSKTTGTVTPADTVTISVNFNENVKVTGTPTLTLNDGGSATLTGGSGTGTLVFAYTPVGAQNTTALATTGLTGGTISDSAGTPANLANVAQTFTGLAVHAPPTLTVGGTVNYSETGSPVALDSTLTVSDPDSGGLLQSAKVQITSGFAAGDALSVNLTGTPSITVGSNANGTLTLSGSDTLADYQAALRSVTFASTAPEASTTSRTLTWSVNDGVASSAAGETSTVNVAPCYVRGTRILTERGEVAVEELRVGDLAITAAGARRPIVWLGHRRLDLVRHPRPVAVRPVRVTVGAFGDNLPHRDLWLSPGHNVVSEGALMPISSLINGRSVTQIEQDRVEYWHVELDAHDILIAEGLPAESYLDCGNREAFDNGGAFVEAHPDFQPKHWAQTCLPLIKLGAQVQATRARLIARLFASGFALDAQDGAHVLVDGVRVAPFRMDAWRLGFTLPAGGARIELRSRTFVPAHARADGEDERELGLCVAGLEIDGETILLEADDLDGSGWHAAEFERGRFARRWTRGAAPLPAGARRIVVDLAELGQYWRDPVRTTGTDAEPTRRAG